jgi:hypothetical protein
VPCALPTDPGPCNAVIPRWSFDAAAGICRPFHFGGCAGNANNFETKGQCERVCGNAPPAEPCDPDPCRNVRCLPYQECRVDPESGRSYCADSCDRFPCPPGAQCELTPVECVQSPCPPLAQCVPQAVCDQPVALGPCNAVILRWYHDAASGTCRPFTYGGCGANDNNFETSAACERQCPPAPPCEQSKDAGPCDGAFQRWWHNPDTGQCESFVYGGCGGNQNNFASARDCEAKCK